MTAAKMLFTSLSFALTIPAALAFAGPPGPKAPAGQPGTAGHDDPAGHGDHAGHGHPAGHGDHAGHAGAGGPGGHDPLVHRFTDPKKWAQEFDAPDRDGWQKPRELVAALGLQPGMKVVDLGAGTGYFEPFLHAAVVGPGKDKDSRAGQVWAVDIEAPMVDYLRARAEREKLTTVQAHQGSPADPQLPAASFDRVLAVDVWHHIPERPAYARKLAAGLKPEGAVYVVDFKLDAKKGPPRHHRLKPEAVAADLVAAGLVIEAPPALKLAEQYIVVGRKPKAAPAPAPSTSPQ